MRRLIVMVEILQKIVVPEGVKVIGQNTFAHMKNLKRVSLPQSVTTLEHNVFYKRQSVTKVNIAAGNKTFKAKKNVISSKNGKSLYLIYGKVKSITIDAKVRQLSIRRAIKLQITSVRWLVA